MGEEKRSEQDATCIQVETREGGVSFIHDSFIQQILTEQPVMQALRVRHMGHGDDQDS